MNNLNFPRPLRQCFSDVYEPAEDSFFLLDVLETELFSEGNKGSTYETALELCCGSGVITVNLAQRLPETVFFCTDVNLSACTLTSEVARLSACPHNVEAVRTDMCEALACRLAGKVDLLFCNPPYVPIEEEENADHSVIGLSWAGGKDGVEAVVSRFLSVVVTMLSKDGVSYLLMLEENNPQKLMTTAKEQYALGSSVLSTKRFFNEKLSIVKFWKK